MAQFGPRHSTVIWSTVYAVHLSRVLYSLNHHTVQFDPDHSTIWPKVQYNLIRCKVNPGPKHWAVWHSDHMHSSSPGYKKLYGLSLNRPFKKSAYETQITGGRGMGEGGICRREDWVRHSVHVDDDNLREDKNGEKKVMAGGGWQGEVCGEENSVE
jgi:hypothetical protein